MCLSMQPVMKCWSLALLRVGGASELANWTFSSQLPLVTMVHLVLMEDFNQKTVRGGFFLRDKNVL